MVLPVRQTPIPGGAELDLAEKTTDLSTAIGSTASVVVAQPNLHRTALWLINNSDVEVYLGLGRPATVTSGIRLNAAGGAIELNLTNLFRGQINALAASGADKGLLILELETRYAYT